MAELIWLEKYSVGVEALDQQHQTIIGLINELNAEDRTGHTPDAVNRILDQLAGYVTSHFRTEEDYMERFDYEDIEAHLEEHIQYIETIARLTEEQIEDRDNVHGELIAFLNHWWTDHILEADQKYTKTFNIHGLH
ncbi:MAG: hemerythrin family protein [Rhodospirillaceae bacterium]|nr:hemerythrin family protein [Rhodospirillaceae bacterium]